ncbi:MAG: hypothetical protein IJ697_06960 [Synergistaceae bacterium]|nr:hypothetical protein [Synergistaceae bacterium]
MDDGIWRSVYEIHFVVWNMLEEQGGNMYVECLASGATKKAEATVNNFARMPKSEVRRFFSLIPTARNSTRVFSRYSETRAEVFRGRRGISGLTRHS